MSDQVDRRIIRTRKLIKDAFSELLEEKGFDGITVRDITTKAGINRGTFYLHYQDKYDLLEQSEKDIIQEIQEWIPGELKPIDILNLNLQDEPIPYLIKLFECMKRNASFMKVILGPQGDPAFQVKVKEVIKIALFQQKIIKNLKEEDMLVPKEHFIAYIISAHLGVLQHWLESGMEKSPREMALVITRMTFLGPMYAAGLWNESGS